MGYPERTGSMPWRMLSGRPRHLQVLVLSLVVLTIGVATAYGRTGGSTANLETAAAVDGGQFNDVPPPALAADPPTTAAPPATTAPAPAASSTTTAPAPDRSPAGPGCRRAQADHPARQGHVALPAVDVRGRRRGQGRGQSQGQRADPSLPPTRLVEGRLLRPGGARPAAAGRPRRRPQGRRVGL